MSKQRFIRLSWKVTHQHVEYMTPEEFEVWLDQVSGSEINSTDLDAAYAYLDSEDYAVVEALEELANDGNWSDTETAQMIDLTDEEVEIPA